MEAMQPGRILFLGEQDGKTEQELKLKLSTCFSNDLGIKSAYLLRVSYDKTFGTNVALCISYNARSREELLARVTDVFSKMFHATQHMDILFVSDQQITTIDNVARPFYTAPTQ